MEWPAPGNGFRHELLIEAIFRLATLPRTEQQPTDSETSVPLRAKPKRQRLGFLLHATVAPPNPASFSSNLLEPEALTGLVRHQNEVQPRCG